MLRAEGDEIVLNSELRARIWAHGPRLPGETLMCASSTGSRVLIETLVCAAWWQTISGPELATEILLGRATSHIQAPAKVVTMTSGSLNTMSNPSTVNARMCA